MTGLAIDALNSSLNPKAFKAAGYDFALRYLKDLSKAEAATWIGANMGLGTIFEAQADASLSGAALGVQHGQQAAAWMSALGQPAGTLHVVNLADFAPTSSQLGAIESYWDAYIAQTSHWLVLPYGTGWLLNAMAVWGWQNAMNDNGWPGNQVCPYAAIYQRVAPTRSVLGTPPTQFDEDPVLKDLTWWGIAPPMPAPPVPNPLSRPISLAGGKKMVQDVQIRTEGSGEGWDDVPVPANMTWVSCTPLLAAPGTPGITPSTPHNYDLGHAAFTVGAPKGKVRVQITGTVPNSVRGVRVQFEAVG